MALRQIAEMLPGDRHQSSLTEAAFIQGDNRHDPLQEIGAVVGKMAHQQLAHVTFAVAMAQQQHHLGVPDGVGDPRQVVAVERSPLTCQIAVVAMGEGCAAAPEAMGPQNPMVHRVALQMKHIGVVMVEVEHQPPALIPPWRRGGRRGMVGADVRLLQQVA